MRHKEGNFTGLKDLNIYYQAWQPWQPDQTARAVLLIAHGTAEHSGRYLNVVNYLVPKGFAVYAHDHRGHGRSGGERLHVDAFSDYIKDIKTFFDIVHSENPECRVFLIGHSMGSIMALLYATEHQHELAGLVTSGGGIAKPGTPPPTGLKPGDSRDPEVTRAYQNDPLVYHGPVPPGLGFKGMLGAAIDRLYDAVQTITIPTLIMAGTGMIDGERSRVLYDRIGSQDKTLRLYEGLLHEVFNEPEHLQVLADLESWLEGQLRN